jgi:hypothetical protein
MGYRGNLDFRLCRRVRADYLGEPAHAALLGVVFTPRYLSGRPGTLLVHFGVGSFDGGGSDRRADSLLCEPLDR